MSEELFTFDMVHVKLDLSKKLKSRKKISTPESAIELCGDIIRQLDRETLMMLNLDGAGQPINCSVVSVGILNGTLVGTREIIKTAILSNAAAIMILHNHPSGNVTASKEDINITHKLYRACKLMDLELLDHIIVGPLSNEIYSMRREEGVFDRFSRPNLGRDFKVPEF